MNNEHKQFTEGEIESFSRSREASDKQLLREGAEEIINPETGEKVLLATPEQKRFIEMSEMLGLVKAGEFIKRGDYPRATGKIFRSKLAMGNTRNEFYSNMRPVIDKLSQAEKIFSKNTSIERGEVFDLTDGDKGLSELAFIITDPQEDLQPLGLKIYRDAQQKGIQTIIFSTDHAVGKDAVKAIATELTQEVIPGYTDQDVLVAGKIGADHWLDAFQRITEKCGKNHGRFLIVEDNLEHHNGFGSVATPHNGGIIIPRGGATIRQTIESVRANCGYENMEIDYARDYDEAQVKMEETQYEGVITDCFFPKHTDSMDKQLGNEVVNDVLRKKFGSERASEILAKAQSIQNEYTEAITTAYRELSDIARSFSAKGTE